MKVLVLNPHIDDAEFACGATIAKHTARGDEVMFVTFSSCAESLPEEWRNPNKLIDEHELAMYCLGVGSWYVLRYPVRKLDIYAPIIRNIIYNLVNRCFIPDLIYTPWSGSVHQDHAAISRFTMQVCGRKDIDVLGYYISGDGVGFAPNHFERLDYIDVEAKMTALGCYASQAKLRGWWGEDMLRSTVRFWACHTTSECVEAFEVLKRVSK